MIHTALSNCWSRTESERFHGNPKQAAKVWRLVLTPRHVWLVGVHRNTKSNKQNRTKLGKRKSQVHCFSLAWKKFPNPVFSHDEFWFLTSLQMICDFTHSTSNLWFHTAPCPGQAQPAPQRPWNHVEMFLCMHIYNISSTLWFTNTLIAHEKSAVRH